MKFPITRYATKSSRGSRAFDLRYDPRAPERVPMVEPMGTPDISQASLGEPWSSDHCVSVQTSRANSPRSLWLASTKMAVHDSKQVLVFSRSDSSITDSAPLRGAHSIASTHPNLAAMRCALQPRRATRSKSAFSAPRLGSCASPVAVSSSPSTAVGLQCAPSRRPPGWRAVNAPPNSRGPFT